MNLGGLLADLTLHPVGVLVDLRLPGRELRVSLVEIPFLLEQPFLRLGEPAFAVAELLLALGEVLGAPSRFVFALGERSRALFFTGPEVAIALTQLLLGARQLLLPLLERGGAVLHVGQSLRGPTVGIGERLLRSASRSSRSRRSRFCSRSEALCWTRCSASASRCSTAASSCFRSAADACSWASLPSSSATRRRSSSSAFRSAARERSRCATSSSIWARRAPWSSSSAACLAA